MDSVKQTMVSQLKDGNSNSITILLSVCFFVVVNVLLYILNEVIRLCSKGVNLVCIANKKLTD